MWKIRCINNNIEDMNNQSNNLLCYKIENTRTCKMEQKIDQLKINTDHQFGVQ